MNNSNEDHTAAPGDEVDPATSTAATDTADPSGEQEPTTHLRRDGALPGGRSGHRRRRVREPLGDPGRHHPAGPRRPRRGGAGTDRYRQDRRVRATDPLAHRSRGEEPAGTGPRTDA